MSSTSGSIGVLPIADNAHVVGSHYVVIPAAGTPQVVNPDDDHHAMTAYNLGAVLVRALVTFKSGVTGNAVAAQAVQLIPPNGVMSFDLSSNTNSVNGELGAIESVTFTPVAVPTVSTEGSALTALTANAGTSLIANFVRA